jgi:hypothetical protein
MFGLLMPMSNARPFGLIFVIIHWLACVVLSILALRRTEARDILTKEMMRELSRTIIRKLARECLVLKGDFAIWRVHNWILSNLQFCVGLRSRVWIGSGNSQ